MPDPAADLARDGFTVFDPDADIARWAAAAHPIACNVASDPAQQKAWLRHGRTWFVGVDALPNDTDGAIAGVPLSGPWRGVIDPPSRWHRAQVSIVYPGYPKRDEGEAEGAHAFRVTRAAAHVDGLHLEGGRRIVREPHSFILGIPLNESGACPLVVWRCSHVAMRAALSHAIATTNPIGADVTEAYKAARAAVFEACERVEVVMRPGQAVLVDRFALHGVAPWQDGMTAPREGRMIAYFRPDCSDPADWLG